MFVVIEVPDAAPEEIAGMVMFVGSEMETGAEIGTSKDMRWAIVRDENDLLKETHGTRES